MLPGYDYYVGDVRDSNLYYELVVMPNHDASVGTNYTFDTKIDLIYGTHTESFTPELAVMDVEAAVVSSSIFTQCNMFVFCIRNNKIWTREDNLGQIFPQKKIYLIARKACIHILCWKILEHYF